MRKISFVIGSKVEIGETQERFTATCECGNHIYIAKKETSLNYLLNKTTKCCNKPYTLTGTQMIIATENGMEIAPAPDATPDTSNIDVNSILIPGKKGITNHSVIVAIKENLENEKVLIALYQAYPEIYKASLKYLNDKQKLICRAAVADSLQDFKITLGKRSMDKIPA